MKSLIHRLFDFMNCIGVTLSVTPILFRIFDFPLIHSTPLKAFLENDLLRTLLSTETTFCTFFLINVCNIIHYVNCIRWAVFLT